MKIVRRDYFILAIIEILTGIMLVVLCILINRTSRIGFAFMPIGGGIFYLSHSVKTKKQIQKEKSKLQHRLRSIYKEQ